MRIARETAYVLAVVILAFSVALCIKADLGLSMLAAPSYILYERFHVLSYGKIEYILQGLVLVIMCLIVRKWRWSYLAAFATAVIYGMLLDMFIWFMRDWNPTDIYIRLTTLAVGVILTAVAVALYFRTYLPPTAYDLLVRTVVQEKDYALPRVKLTNDLTYLTIGVILTLTLFHRFVGITLATIVITLVNAPLISYFDKLLDHFKYYDLFPQLAKRF